jgi:alpha-ribazole phosphatase
MDVVPARDQPLADVGEELAQVETLQLEPGSGAPKIRRLWLVRHGETKWNIEKRYFGHYDIELADSGRQQACWLGEQLRPRTLAAIYSSDLCRAYQTAEIIAGLQSRTVTISSSAAWREINFGDWEGLTYTEIATAYPDQLAFFTDPEHFSPPRGETFADLVLRVQTQFLRLVLDAVDLPDGELVLVSHGGVIRALLCSILGMPFARQWQLKLLHGSLSAIDFLAGASDALATATLASLNRYTVQ